MDLRLKANGTAGSAYPKCPGSNQPAQDGGQFYNRCQVCGRSLRKLPSGKLPVHYSRVEVK